MRDTKRYFRKGSFLWLVWLLVGMCAAQAETVKTPDASQIIRVACIGDSITFGATIDDPQQNGYPAQLGRMLGEGWEVRNFGVSGRTLLNRGDYPYRNEPAFQEALAFGPQVVLIKLGTNDTKPQNWQYKDEFVNDYKQMIGDFSGLVSRPRIFACYPVPAYPGQWGISDKLIREEVIPLIDQAARETGVAILDLYTALNGRPEMFPDQVHPNVTGAGLIAKTICEVLTDKKPALPAVEEPFPGTKTNWFGFAKYDFSLKDYACCVVTPTVTAAGKPWIWRARFFGHEPQTDIALLERGFHLVYADVAGLFGSPAAVERWNHFYRFLVEEHGFAPKAALEGMSRGGLIVYNWAAANPDKVACIYADAPVCDFKSWPGGKGKSAGSPEDWQQCLKAYGLTEEQAMAYRYNPIDNLAPLARAGVPLLHVCGEADEVVPMEENTRILEKRYQELGGPITVISKPGVGHHPHSLQDPLPIVDFILVHTLGHERKIEAAYHIRSGLTNARIRFERDKMGRVAFMGGSITEAEGYRPLICQALQQRFPETKFDFINAGIASTDSTLGAFRLGSDVLGKGWVDLFFIEFAVNDSGNGRSETDSIRGMEGIIRQARDYNPTMEIIVLYFYDPAKREDISREKTPAVIAAHEKVMRHYGIISIDLAQEVTDRMNAGEFEPAQFSGDGVHPAPLGCQIYADAVGRTLDMIWGNPLPAEFPIRNHSMPAPLDPLNYSRGRFVDLKQAELVSGWEYVPSWNTSEGQTRSQFVNVPALEAKEPGATLKLKFTGTAIGLLEVAGPDVGIIEFSIDGQPFQKLDQFTFWSDYLHIPWAYMLATDLPTGDHEITIRITDQKNEKSKGFAARIEQFLVN